MTEWGIDTLFNPGKRHMDEEKRRLQSTREEIGDASGGQRIDLESGTVRISRSGKAVRPDAPASESPAAADGASDENASEAGAAGEDATDEDAPDEHATDEAATGEDATDELSPDDRRQAD